LSTVEAGIAAIAFRIAGAGPLPLKAAMLVLWSGGVCALFLALTHMVGRNRAFWIAAVVVLTPGWAVWSMKARGGYLTSFAAASLLLAIVVRPRERDTPAWWMAAGALVAVVWLAQPIWMPSVLPFLVYALVSRRRLTPTILCVSVAAAVVFAIKLLPVASSDMWAGPPLGNPAIWGARVRVAQQLFVTLSGSYYLTAAIDPPGPVTRALATGWCVAFLLLAAAQIYRVATQRVCRWSHLLFASVALTFVANWTLLFARDGRYLLPLVAPLVMLAGIDSALLPAVVAPAVLVAALAAGSASLYEFRNFSFLWTNPPNAMSETHRLQLVINALTSRGVTHVFSMNGLLESQLNFYSGERIVARSVSANDRYPRYVDEANRALRAGEPVAVVGYTNDSGAPGCWDVPICTGGIDRLVPNPEAIFTIDHKYFVYTGAHRALLQQLRFELPAD
jgi:hypothetical protein